MLLEPGRREHAAHEPPISRELVAEVQCAVSCSAAGVPAVRLGSWKYIAGSESAGSNAETDTGTAAAGEADDQGTRFTYDSLRCGRRCESRTADRRVHAIRHELHAAVGE